MKFIHYYDMKLNNNKIYKCKNKMPLVDMQCFKLSKYPNNCLHYVLYNCKDYYNLNYDYNIKLHLDNPYFKKASNI
jgi:hypothetical protein